MKSFKFKSSSKSSLTKNLHHLKLSSQFKSMPKSTTTNFQLHQTQSLNPPTWMIPWIPPAMSRMLFSCIVNYHSPWRTLVCMPKWLRNSTHVLKEVHQEDRLSKVDFNHEDLPSKKTLGVVWTAEADVFTFKTKPPKSNLPLTKRNGLKNVATLFDPLGLITLYCHVDS